MRRNLLIGLILVVVAAGIYAAFNGGGPGRGGDDNGGGGQTAGESGTPVISFNAVGPFKHDTAAFTEGLSFYKGQLWESTGEKGKSYLFTYDMNSGQRGKSFTMPSDYFGEGHVILRDTAYMLSWQEHKAFLVDANTMKQLAVVDYPRDGWGMTTNGTELIASEGTSNLYFLEPGTLRLLRTVGVTENGSPVANINELEWVNGVIYANIWQSNYIIKIDPVSGQVLGRMDLTELINRARQVNPAADVLNGIAYNPDTKKFYVTGKNWPQLYELQFSF